MATLILSTGGAAIGGALFGPAGAAVGQAAGAYAGSYIDQSLFAPSERPPQSGSAGDVHILASTEGAPIPRLYGNSRISGQIIWSAPYKEYRRNTSSGSGKGTPAAPSTSQTYYTASFAVGLCEGEIAAVERIWADGEELDMAGLTFRLHKGTPDQLPDALIEAVQGSTSAPAYRDLAYIVFEELDLAPFGNRVPQLSFELSRPMNPIMRKMRAVNMIPAATEFGYHPKPHQRSAGRGRKVSENTHNAHGVSNWTLSLNQLEDKAPNCGYVALVVSWFADDLRLNDIIPGDSYTSDLLKCQIRPGSEGTRTTSPTSWRVAGIGRREAHQISRINGRPAFGGTPSDASVIAAIRDLKRRGFKVMFYPFILMDIPAGNTLPNPYGGTGQPVYPWRGYLTCNPAPDMPGTPEARSVMKPLLRDIFRPNTVDDFSVQGEEISYTGDKGWTWGRMIMHYARLCQIAGGVDAFLVGSEMRSVTRLRYSPTGVECPELMAKLAKGVKSALPNALVSYAADWTEYGHQNYPGGIMLYPMDGFWRDQNVDFIGIDYYMPLADWRDGRSHKDAAAANSIYSLDYLRKNITGGEYFDWYYNSAAQRASQQRQPINDPLHRLKDLAAFWKSRHYGYSNNRQLSSPSPWEKYMKPIWFTEVGCPAVDKGANQPNVFYDPKSSDSARPYFSSGARDDAMQERYLEALMTAYDPEDPHFIEAANPIAPSGLQKGKRMLNPEHMFVWAWDARPYPAFPQRSDIWGDAPNWTGGHWINGRLTYASLKDTVRDILIRAGIERYDVEDLHGIIRGLTLDKIMPPREALDWLMRLYFFDAVESGGVLRFFHRDGKAAAAISEAQCVRRAGEESSLIARRQTGDLPQSIKLVYINGDGSYRQAVAEAQVPPLNRQMSGYIGQRIAEARLPLVASADSAAKSAEIWLRESWAARESAQLLLPPSRLALEAGDIISFASRLLRITAIQEADVCRVEAVSVEPKIYGLPPVPKRTDAAPYAPVWNPPAAALLDLPSGIDASESLRLYIAANASPWPGALAVYRSPAAAHGFAAIAEIRQRAVIGVSASAFAPAAAGRWQYNNTLQLQLNHGALISRTPADVLNGANLAAIQHSGGEWEIVQFQNARLLAEGFYEVSGFLRGLGGSDHLAGEQVQTGAQFVLLDSALHKIDYPRTSIGRSFYYRIGPAGRPQNDDAFIAAAHKFSGISARPLSPVHVRGQKTSSGAIAFSWIRRSRIGGDNWDVAEIPLGEETENYELEIIKAGAAIRTLTASAPSLTYPAASIASDFPAGLPSALTVRLYQRNGIFGRSPAREVIINV